MMRITYPKAKTRKIWTIWLGWNSNISDMREEVSVVTEAAAATVEFFNKAMRVLPKGAMDPRKAWGRSDPGLGKPRPGPPGWC